VFASNDDMALGVLAAAQRLGLTVPGDISIAGFDDSNASDLVWPTLTTVRQPMEEMARVAVDMLIARDPGDSASGPAPSQHRVLPHQLLVRDSTSAPSAKSALEAKRRN
jgi:LacI family transcriptional regulator